MNDTNPMFAKFDQALGKTTPTVAGAPTQNRAAEIRALAHAAPSSDTTVGSAGQTLRDHPATLAETAQDFGGFAKDGLPAVLPAVGAIAGGVGGAALGVPGGPLGVYAGSVGGAALGGAAGETAKEGIDTFTGKAPGLDAGKIAQTGAEYGALEGIGGPVAAGLGKVAQGAGEMLGKSAIPLSMKEAGLVQAYKANTPFWDRVLTGAEGAPVTAGKTAFDKGLGGTESMIGVQAKRAANNLWTKAIGPALTSSEAKVNMPAFFGQLQRDIIASTPEKARQADLLNALSSLKEDYAGVTDVPLADLQKFKEGWAEFVPEKAYQGKPIAGAFNDLKDMAASNARSIIYKDLGPEVKQAYFDYGNLKGIQELGKRAMTGGKLKGGFGGFWSAIKDMTLTPIATVGGQAVYKVGQGVELFGKPGARYVRDIIPPLEDSTSEPSPQ